MVQAGSSWATSSLASLSSKISCNKVWMSTGFGQFLLKCPGSPQQKQPGGRADRLRRASTSIGTGFPGVGMLCACFKGTTGTGRWAVGVAAVEKTVARERGMDPRYADWKASLVARFWSQPGPCCTTLPDWSQKAHQKPLWRLHSGSGH